MYLYSTDVTDFEYSSVRYMFLPLDVCFFFWDTAGETGLVSECDDNTGSNPHNHIEGMQHELSMRSGFHRRKRHFYASACWKPSEALRYQAARTWLCVVNVGLWVRFFHILNGWAYFNEAHQNYSILGPYDIDDIFKVIGSKVKVRQRWS